MNNIKKQEDRILCLSHGTCSYICMHINAVANCIMFYLQQDFYNTTFKIKHKSYIASGSPPPAKNSGCAPALHYITLHYITCTFNTPSSLFILGPVNALWSYPLERTDNASTTTGRYHYTSTAPLIMAFSKSSVSWTYEIRGKINLTDT
jgi:hypothetical protein